MEWYEKRHMFYNLKPESRSQGDQWKVNGDFWNNVTGKLLNKSLSWIVKTSNMNAAISTNQVALYCYFNYDYLIYRF